MSDQVEPTGAWQVVLSVVMVGDMNKLDKDKAQEKLITKMSLLVAEMRDQFPGRLDVATITPYIVGAPEMEI